MDLREEVRTKQDQLGGDQDLARRDQGGITGGDQGGVARGDQRWT